MKNGCELHFICGSMDPRLRDCRHGNLAETDRCSYLGLHQECSSRDAQTEKMKYRVKVNIEDGWVTIDEIWRPASIDEYFARVDAGEEIAIPMEEIMSDETLNFIHCPNHLWIIKDAVLTAYIGSFAEVYHAEQYRRVLSEKSSAMIIQDPSTTGGTVGDVLPAYKKQTVFEHRTEKILDDAGRVRGHLYTPKGD